MITGIYLDGNRYFPPKPDQKVGEICKVMCPEGYMITYKVGRQPRIILLKGVPLRVAKTRAMIEVADALMAMQYLIKFKKVVIPTAKKRKTEWSGIDLSRDPRNRLMQP